MFFANFGIGKYRFSYYENRLRNLGFTQFRKCFSFMHCNMVSLIALDGILGVFFGGVMCVALVIKIGGMYFYNLA